MFVFPRHLLVRWFLLPFLVLLLVQGNFLTDLFDRITNKKPKDKNVEHQDPSPVVANTAEISSNSTVEEKLRIEVLDKPEVCDEFAIKGKQVYINFLAAIYTEKGENPDGKPEGMIIDKGKNDFLMGGSHIMPGLSQGVEGMCVGERRRLIIPPSLGMEGMTLSYDVQLTSIGEGKPPVNMWRDIDFNGDHVLDEAEMDRYFLETKQFKSTPEGAFASQDKDGDGLVTWDEFDGPKGDEHPSLTSSSLPPVSSSTSSSSEEL